tara:strand:- start:133 stop:399 length:267 start_codon:yes stop_codon:yes gene_type:complete
MNFNNLPNDIKRLIFDKNREEVSKEIKVNKNLFNKVVEDINYLGEYFEENYDPEYLGNDMLAYLCDIQIERANDIDEEEALMRYYGIV